MPTVKPTPWLSGASSICADTNALTLVSLPGLPASATVLPSLRRTFALSFSPQDQWVLYIYTAAGAPCTTVHLDAALFSGITLESGWDHALLLDTPSGLAYSFGLAEGPPGTPPPIPHPLTFKGRVTSLACGEKHSAAVVEGRVYTWGASRCNALGLWGEEEGGAPFTAASPTDTLPANSLLSSDDGEVFISVRSGWGFCCALSSHARVAVWGANKHGQCASSPCKWVVPTWVREGGKDHDYLRATSLACGWSHCIAIKAATSPEGWCFFSWGRGDMGQLGRGCPKPVDGTHTPGVVAGVDCTCGAISPPSSPTAVCGSESTIVALPCGQCVWAWGWNEHGNLGVGEGLESRWEPTRVPLPPGMRVHQGGVRAAGATLIMELTSGMA